MALTGTAAGGTIGSIIPGIGTAVGATVGGIVDLVKSIFGGQVYGADFEYRKQKLQEWISADNLTGRQKYVDPVLLKELLFEDTGWQNDVQQYLAQVQRYLDTGTPRVGTGEANFTSDIVGYVEKVKYLGTGNTDGIVDIVNTPTAGTSTAGFSWLGAALILGALSFLFLKN